MNETLKRAISGAIYVILLLASILYSTESFFILFGVFLLIALYEFCHLVQINCVFPMISGISLYSAINLVSHYNKQTTIFLNKVFQSDFNLNVNIQQLDLILLAVTIVVSVKCILFLFTIQFKK